MKNLIKLALGATSLVGVMATAAHADTAPPTAISSILGSDYGLSAAVALQSDYRFRGISQNFKQPAEQATLNLTGPDGFYAGTWASKINWGTTTPTLETDWYGGKHTDLWGTDLNTEFYFYGYPDANSKGAAAKNASYYELITQLSHPFGPLTLTGTWAYSPLFGFGNGNSNYLEGTAAFTVTDWLSVSGNFGHQWVQRAKYNASSDYSHYDIGATATYKAFSLDARWVGTDLTAGKCNFYMGTKNACSGGFVATLTYNISAFPW